MSEQEVLTEEAVLDAENDDNALRPYCVNKVASDPVDPETVKSAQNGDDEAFSKIFWQTYRYVFGIAKRYLRRDEDIYDAIQDTYTNVYANLGKLKAPEAFVNWVGKIAVTCSRTMAEKMAAAGAGDLEDEELVEIDDTDGELRKEVVIDVTAVLSQMDPADAELLTYVYYDRLRVTEIARMQGVPATTVYSRLNAAKRRLKELLRIRGIEKAVYGGDLVAIITTALRNAIGTNLLSMAVAAEILHSVTGKKTKAAAVVAAVARKQRNAAALKIASWLLAAAMLVFGVLTLVYYSVKPSSDRGRTPSNGGLTASVSTEVSDTDESGANDISDHNSQNSESGQSSQNTEVNSTPSDALSSASSLGFDTGGNTDGTSSSGTSSTGTSGEIGGTDDPDQGNEGTGGTGSSSTATSSSKPSSTVSTTTSSTVTSSSKPSTSSTTSTTSSSTSSATNYPTSNLTSYYTYTVADNAATITAVNKAISGDVTIPSTLGGYPVVCIGEKAFMDCAKINSIVIPNGVTTVDYYAFNNCVNMNSISIPPSVTRLEPAFGGCTSLEGVYITDLKAWCNIFTDDGNLSDLPTYHSRKLYLNGKLLSGEVVIPAGVNFYTLLSPLSCLEDVASFVISDGVTIRERVDLFYGCKNLKSVYIPDSLTNIRHGLFAGCSSLEKIEVNKNSEVYISDGCCLIEKESKELVAGCDNSVIPTDGSVTSIGDFAFSCCTGLSSINIPNSITSVGLYAFFECQNLHTVYYEGTAAQWKKIKVDSSNSCLLNATVVYNSK